MTATNIPFHPKTIEAEKRLLESFSIGAGGVAQISPEVETATAEIFASAEAWQQTSLGRDCIIAASGKVVADQGKAFLEANPDVKEISFQMKLGTDIIDHRFTENNLRSSYIASGANPETAVELGKVHEHIDSLYSDTE